jgi:hypothetical protein
MGDALLSKINLGNRPMGLMGLSGKPNGQIKLQTIE